jgi:ribosomal peptide maturation radical SAM protein 1
MYDNIMPHSYFKTLLPRLQNELGGLYIFYEQKANLSLGRVQALLQAGIRDIQPGIESLSTSLLQRMDKGVTAAQNLALLRYARSIDLVLRWNLLYAFPGDHLAEYEEMLELLPFLRHLQPPTALYQLSLDRFSPYFDRPHQYGITNLRPIKAYEDILPPQADVYKTAYHFTGDYESKSKPSPDVISRIYREVDEWRRAWDASQAELPVLALTEVTSHDYLLLDTRGLPGTQMFNFIDEETARVALAGHRGAPSPAVDWALEHKTAVEIDNWIVPLATASPELIAKFEAEQSAPVKQERRTPLGMAVGS